LYELLPTSSSPFSRSIQENSPPQFQEGCCVTSQLVDSRRSCAEYNSAGVIPVVPCLKDRYTNRSNGIHPSPSDSQKQTSSNNLKWYNAILLSRLIEGIKKSFIVLVFLIPKKRASFRKIFDLKFLP